MRDISRVKVLVADDHAMVREGIAEMLSLNEDIEVVGHRPETAARRSSWRKRRNLT